jgi:chromatin remodeling complex protein RSC6
LLQTINAFVFTGETRYAPAAGSIFQQSEKERRVMATTSKTASARKPNAAFMKPLTPSADLAAVIGPEAVPRTEVTKKIWEYIKKHNLQDASNKRNINADDKLRPLFGKDQVSMFELTKLVNAHLK